MAKVIHTSGHVGQFLFSYFVFEAEKKNDYRFGRMQPPFNQEEGGVCTDVGVGELIDRIPTTSLSLSLRLYFETIFSKLGPFST